MFLEEFNYVNQENRCVSTEEIFSDDGREDSDEENSNNGNSDEENCDEEN